MQMSQSVRIAAISLIMVSSSSVAETLKTIDFDSKQVAGKRGRTILDSAGTIVLRATIDKGTRALKAPEVVKHGCLSKPGCLKVSMDETSASAAKNKIMFAIWGHDQKSKLGEKVVVGDGFTTKVSFAMKLDKTYQDPTNNMIHFQAFQPRRQGDMYEGKVIPGGPIISFKMVPAKHRQIKNRNVQEYVIAVRNPSTAGVSTYMANDRAMLFRAGVQKGRWYKFTILMTSRTQKNGIVGGPIALEVDGKRVMQKDVAWGFNPSKFPVSRTLGFDLGIYRSADRRGKQAVYFDDVSVIRF